MKIALIYIMNVIIASIILTLLLSYFPILYWIISSIILIFGALFILSVFLKKPVVFKIGNNKITIGNNLPREDK